MDGQERADRIAIIDAINTAITEGWGVARITAVPPTRRYTVRFRVVSARRWVHSRLLGWRLVVECHDDTPHYCYGRRARCYQEWYLSDDDVDPLLLDLTAKDVRVPGEPVLRGGRLT